MEGRVTQRRYWEQIDALRRDVPAIVDNYEQLATEKAQRKANGYGQIT